MKTKEIDNWKRFNVWFWISVAFYAPLLPALFLTVFGQFLPADNVIKALDFLPKFSNFFSLLTLPLLITLLVALFYAVRCAGVLFKNIPAIPFIAFILFVVIFYYLHLVGLLIIYAVIYFRKKQLGQSISLITRKEIS